MVILGDCTNISSNGRKNEKVFIRNENKYTFLKSGFVVVKCKNSHKSKPEFTRTTKMRILLKKYRMSRSYFP